MTVIRAALLIAAVGVLGMLATAALDWRIANAGIAAAVVLALVALSFGANRSALAAGDAAVGPRGLARWNAYLMAITSLWASLAIAAMYYLTGLQWYHAYQYALLFDLPALASVLFARAVRVAPEGPGLARLLALGRWLTRMLAALSAIGIAALIGLGKAFSAKSDWAASNVFLFAAAGLMLLSVTALRTQARAEQTSA